MLLCLLFVGLTVPSYADRASSGLSSFATLTPGSSTSGFRVVAIYTGNRGAAIGARFIHQRTGFVFDCFQLETAPQAYIYANTAPTSDKGEPHTQEHLLLGKGNKGRSVADAEAVSLSASSAYTMQWRTCYFFNTTAGTAAFYDQLYRRMDALLHPDYTDEEVRREVRNFGVAVNPDGSLRLEEKGTVYNEMVSTMSRSDEIASRTLQIDLFGESHPLSWVSGGTPEALRTLTPKEIRTFHDRHYYLGNMGMVASIPPSEPLEVLLKRIDETIHRLQPGPNQTNAPPIMEPSFPEPRRAASTEPQIVSFPNADPEQPGEIDLAWPANRKPAVTDLLLARLFFDSLAGDVDTPLYEKFIDTKRHTIDTGATAVSSFVADDIGMPITIGLSNVRPSYITPEGLKSVRSGVVAELERLAALPDHSTELAHFNSLVLARMVATRRSFSKLVNSPPGFGERMVGSDWMDTCRMLESVPGDRKSLLFTPQFRDIEQRLSSGKNIWRQLLKDWSIQGVTPYIVGARADAALAARLQQERNERIQAEVKLLATRYGVAEQQQAIQRFSKEYDAESRRQEQIAGSSQNLVHFVSNPPLDLDASLHYTVSRIGHNIPLFAAGFSSMSAITFRLNLDISRVSRGDLVYLSAMPTLLDNCGVVISGKPISYEEAAQRQRREILSLSTGFNSDATTGRHELVITAAGNDIAEGHNALSWMGLALNGPNWQISNLARMQDAVRQKIDELHNQMLGQEEFWVDGVYRAWRDQRDPVALATDCFMTREHSFHRLKWMLMSHPSDIESRMFTSFLPILSQLVRVDSERSQLSALFAALSEPNGTNAASLSSDVDRACIAAVRKMPAAAQRQVQEAAKDMAVALPAIPDTSLVHDCMRLCDEMSADFQQGPAETIHKLQRLRHQIVRGAGARARVVVVSSPTGRTAILPELNRFALTLNRAATYSTAAIAMDTGVVTKRLRDRIPNAKPLYVALVAPSMNGATVMNYGPGARYTDYTDETLLRMLATNLYGGGGGKSVFMKTWGAGLAYGNGIGSNLSSGTVSYYADHTPELPQTVKFVVDMVTKEPEDASLIDYALAAAFQTYESGGYEARAFIRADELEDGITPERVRALRNRLLALRARRDILEEVYKRLPLVMRTILPGYDGKIPDQKTGGRYVVIGPDKQLNLYEAYLQKNGSPTTQLYRLYPRDFWIVDTVGSGSE